MHINAIDFISENIKYLADSYWIQDIEELKSDIKKQVVCAAERGEYSIIINKKLLYSQGKQIEEWLTSCGFDVTMIDIVDPMSNKHIEYRYEICWES